MRVLVDSDRAIGCDNNTHYILGETVSRLVYTLEGYSVFKLRNLYNASLIITTVLETVNKYNRKVGFMTLDLGGPGFVFR